MAGRRRDIDTLPQRAGQAAKAVSHLGNAFEELARGGTVSNTALMQAARSLQGLGPAGQIASAGLVMAIARLDEVAKSGEKLVSTQFAGFNRSLEAAVSFQAKAANAADGLKESWKSLGTIASALTDEEVKREESLKRVSAAMRQNLDITAIAKAGAQGLGAALINLDFSAEGLLAPGLEKTREALTNMTRSEREALLASIEATRQLLARKERIEDEISATERATRAWENFNRQVRLAEDIRKARGQQRDPNAGLVDVSEKRQEVADLEELVQQYENQAATAQATNNEAEYESALRNIAAGEQRIDQLERQIVVMRAVASIADSAIRQTAAGAFDAYADALDETVSMNQLLHSSFDRTMRNVAASTIRSVGQQASVEGAMEAARALAALATYRYDAAANHAAASAAFFGVAALAGIGAGLTSVKGPGLGGSSRKGADGGPGGGKVSVNVTWIGAPDDAALNDFGRRLAKVMSQGDA